MRRIETARLIRRPLTPADAAAVFEGVGDPLVNRYMPYALYTSVAEAEAWMDAACCRLKTAQGQELARYARSTPSERWWRAGVDAAWWNNRR